MKLIEFIRLLLKHKVLLIVVPLFFGLLAIVLTANPKHTYYSQTILYTGLASGSSIEMDKSFNYFATNIAFDNLINIVNSRDTQEEVAIRLLAQHLLLDKADERYISAEAYAELKEKIPAELYNLVVRANRDSSDIRVTSVQNGAATIPSSISRSDFEQTVSNLKALMQSDNHNFVYSLLNFEHPHYSLEAISKVKAQRISNSDLVKLSYEINDPGICQQTLALFNEVCLRKYKDLRENGSDAVVKYFEKQLSQSEKKLKAIEKTLLEFNSDYNIINYYEQSKAVAIVKEDMEVAYNKKKAELAGTEAAVKRLEEKLDIRQQVQQKNNEILQNKKRLGELNYKIALAEARSSESDNSGLIENLKSEASRLDQEIRSSVNELYKFENTTDGVPIKKVLPEWVNKVVETEDLKAKLEVMEDRNEEFKNQYAVYAPAGANLKRIEREINVAEEEYLEILHGLNLAKLKFQDTQLSSNLKAVDPPFFPLKPIPSKRKVIVVAVVLIAFIFLLGAILFMELFDETLKNSTIASEKTGIPVMGMIPKIFRARGQYDLDGIQNRLMDFISQDLRQKANKNSGTDPKVIAILSTRKHEGKSVIAANLAKKIKQSGATVWVLNHSQMEQLQAGKSIYPGLCRLLGYQDPRNDYSQPFLQLPESYLKSTELHYYKQEVFNKAKSYKDLLPQLGNSKKTNPDYIILELPNLLETSYPETLIKQIDFAVLIARANRLWAAADEHILTGLKELLGTKLQLILNGVAIKEVEAVIGELQKKGSGLRRKVKHLLRFQFYSKNQI